ncbi:MAG TPA: VOC family protein [Gammaproteobacteria bacterium]|nr:VOC family protein [Gammaproteobacteria bacterium]
MGNARELLTRAAITTLLAFAAGIAVGQTPSDTLRPLLWQAGMKRSDVGEVNVFRRFSSERTDKMREFYGEVLGIMPLPSTAAGGNAMIRYPVGLSEVKLFPSPPSAPNTATVRAAIGLRLLTFFFTDEKSLAQRFARHGIEPPDFLPTTRPGATSAGLAQDPDGEWVELVIVPNATPEQLRRFEIGLTVADLGASRAFYRDLLGLEEHAPVQDELLGTTRYSYTHGTTTINLWSFGGGLPKDTEDAGLQYIVWNVAGVDAVAQAKKAKIDRPLSAPGPMRTIWLDDPDGVSNYFAEAASNDNTPPAVH